MFSPQVSPEVSASLAGHDTQTRKAKNTKIRQALDAQDLLRREWAYPETGAKEKALLMRTWCELEELIRVLDGKVKPGSRNISVREEPPGKRLAKATKSSLAELYSQYQATQATPMPAPDAPPPTDPAA